MFRKLAIFVYWYFALEVLCSKSQRSNPKWLFRKSTEPLLKDVVHTSQIVSFVIVTNLYFRR